MKPPLNRNPNGSRSRSYSYLNFDVILPDGSCFRSRRQMDGSQEVTTITAEDLVEQGKNPELFFDEVPPTVQPNTD